MNEIQRDISPIRAEEHAARPISPRLYNLIIAGLIFLGFCVMSMGVNIVSTPAFLMWMSHNVLLYMLGSIAGTIAGIVLMSSAVKRQSVARSLVGFALFICTFGLMLSMVLMNYSLPTINTAFLATAGITAVFGALGLAFPQVFQRIAGVLSISLLALIVVQFVMMFLGVDQTWLDIAVIVVFCGFIGYDMYVATTVAPTVPNAVFMACNLFLDIVNVFIRLLNIVSDNR